MEIIRDVPHHHPGDDHQRAGRGVGEKLIHVSLIRLLLVMTGL